MQPFNYKKYLFLDQIPHIALEEQQFDVHIPFSSSPWLPKQQTEH